MYKLLYKIAHLLNYLLITEYKKARSELKKKSSDTLRLQKKNKVRKSLQQQQIYGTLPHGIGQVNATNATGDSELGRLLESSAAVVYEKRQTLEETERKAVRMALLEERGRFCQFAKFLKPVLVSFFFFTFQTTCDSKYLVLY